MNKNSKIKIIASVIAMLGSANVMAQNNVTANFDTTATIESFCSINAGDINFGVVSLPLTAQSANAQMNVLCSNNTPYTVDLSYGGNFVDPTGSSSGSGGYTVSMSFKWTDSYEKQQGYGAAGYRIYKDGQPIGNGYPSSNTSNSSTTYNLNGDMNFGDFVCHGSPSQANKIFFRTQEAADLILPGSAIGSYISDTKGICTGVTGRANIDNFNAAVGNVKISDKGSMVGTFKGDQLAYQITLPNDSTKPWIAKVNSYTATGSGTNQVIDMNAKIVPSASSSSYIAADTYLDTVVATVSY